MYLRYKAGEISFNIDTEKNVIVAKKVVHNKIYTITKALPMMTLDFAQLVKRFSELPEEFWLPIE